MTGGTAENAYTSEADSGEIMCPFRANGTCLDPCPPEYCAEQEGYTAKECLLSTAKTLQAAGWDIGNWLAVCGQVWMEAGQ